MSCWQVRTPQSGGVALDVGCGRGRDVVRLARRFNLHVHGVDPVPSNVGPAMTTAEAEWLARQEMGFGEARSLRPRDVEESITASGLEIQDRVDYASEWGEAGDEHEGSAGRRLLHVARLLRAPQLYIDRYGAQNYRIMLTDCL